MATAVVSAEWSGWAESHRPLSIALGFIFMALALRFPRGLGLLDLMRHGSEVISTKRRLKDWRDVQREVRLQLSE